MEIIFYRLSILLVLSSILGGGFLSLNSHIQENKWNERVRSSYDTMIEGITDCEDKKKSISCALYSTNKEEYDKSFKMRATSKESTNFWLSITYSAPILIIFLFYSLRWVINGKLRPLNLLSK